MGGGEGGKRLLQSRYVYINKIALITMYFKNKHAFIVILHNTGYFFYGLLPDSKWIRDIHCSIKREIV